jgi:hypothetical protein
MLKAMTAIARMDRNRKFKWLRISMSATCLIICCLLTVLWVKSYAKTFPIGRIRLINSNFGITSVSPGLVGISFSAVNPPKNKIITKVPSKPVPPVMPKAFLFIWRNAGAWVLLLPLWFLVLLSATLACVPWLPWQKIRWRFSLRIMLIVTAVVAVLLGIVVWLAR